MSADRVRWFLTIFITIALLTQIGTVAASGTVPASGTRLWAVRSANGGFDVPEAIAVSSNAATVFAVGWWDNGAGGTDDDTSFEVHAFNAATGVERWSSWWRGQDDTSNVAWATDVAVSPDSSTVYVTGGTISPASGDPWGIVTAAFNAATGVRRWAAVYPSSAPDTEALAVSPDGSRVYVSGSADNGSVTVAYGATTGVQVWHRSIAGPLCGVNSASSIVVGPTGARVFVTGDCGADFGTVAFNAATGTTIWSRRYDGPLHGEDRPTGIVVSPDASKVFVTGRSEGTNDADYATIAYRGATGSTAWIRRFDGPAHGSDAPDSIGISPTGSAVYVTGESGYPSTEESATVAYGTVSGRRLWVARYDGAVHTGAWSGGLGVAPDGSKVYVAATAYDASGETRCETMAFSAGGGTRLWTARYVGLRKGASAGPIAVGPTGARVFVLGQLVAGTFGWDFTDWDFATVAYAG
jgi:outer membrane protein assembly factor BamB